MIGPLTIRVGKAVEECCAALDPKIAAVLDTRPPGIEVTMPTVPVFAAAHSVWKGGWAHPRLLWGHFWFLYYQAWLWRCSKRWREYIVEIWLRGLNDKGELEQLLAFYVEAVCSYSHVATCDGASADSAS
jgi:hypothetical protein